MTTAPLQQAPALQDLREKLINSLLAYSASCQEIRQVLVRDFGYEVKDANTAINDEVRRAYGFQQGQP